MANIWEKGHFNFGGKLKFLENYFDLDKSVGLQEILDKKNYEICIGMP